MSSEISTWGDDESSYTEIWKGNYLEHFIRLSFLEANTDLLLVNQQESVVNC